MKLTTNKMPPYRDRRLTVDARVRDLMGRMTIEEKVRQMSMCRVFDITKSTRVSARAVKKFFGRTSIGCMQDPRFDAKESAEAVNAIQKYLVENTRLGIPALIVAECLHGHVSGGATIFPQAIALGSTWNPTLIARMAQVAAKEARAVGVAQALAPDLDLGREPRWGRIEETYGEDPYLVSRMGVAYIKAMQGAEPTIDSEHLICTPKHFAGYGSPEGGLNRGPAHAGIHELRTLYLPPFKAAIQEAGALSIMPSYGEYEAVPASASKLLLTRILREEWGFQGYVFSDYGAVSHLHNSHRVAHTPEEAGKRALEAGMDLEAPKDYGFGDKLLDLVKRGEVAVELIDRAVSRILRMKFLTGLFENPYADIKQVARVVNCPEHRRLAREIAQEAIILLKNAGHVLPLDRNIRSIAVIGPNSDVVQLGGYAIPKPGDISPLQGIRTAVSRRTRVRHAHGCGLFGSSTEGFFDAVAAAKNSDIAIVVIGGRSQGTAGEGWGTDMMAVTCGEFYDRSELTPPGVQQELVEAVYATGTPTIVVMVHGRPYGIPWIAEHIPAIIEAWYPGEEGGNALADVIFGKVNPSGRLTVSVPRSVGHIPAFYNYKPSARGVHHKPGTPDQPGRDYVFSSPAPLFAFGYGLSYTRFKYSDLVVSPRRILPGATVNVSVNVRNVGKVAGKEVVQLYLNDVVSSVTTPVKELRRFEKIALKPGEGKTVRFVLTPDDLQILDEEMNWVVEPGEFEVFVGNLKKSFTVSRPRQLRALGLHEKRLRLG